MATMGLRRSTRLSSKFPEGDSASEQKKRRSRRPARFREPESDEEFCYSKLKGSVKMHSICNPPNTPSKHSNNQFTSPVAPGLLLERLQSTKPAVQNNTILISSDSDSDSEEISVSDTNESLVSPNRTPKKAKSSTKNLDTDCVTPPKQKRVQNDENSPLKTPSVLLEKLSLNSEEKDKNQSEIRNKLFKENNAYVNARKALHSTCPTSMPGRDKELGELREFILNHLEEKHSGTLYVSGPPGTGKTASLNLILQQEHEISSKVTHVYVNCTAIKSSGSIFSRIAKDLGVKCAGKTERDFIVAIENYLTQRKNQTVLLVLDEIDQLESKKQSVLYTIFEWPAHKHSKLILIGIANALDLTDRILPRLQARCELKPQLMHFAPYTKPQIIEILTKRLETAGVLDVFSPAALQMLAGKVAAVSGDLRRALDIGRRVVELVDQKQSCENVLKCLENMSEQQNQKKVELKEVVNVLNNVYGTSQNLNEDVEDSFPLQQKIIVCCLVLILKKARNKDVTVGKLHEVYRKVCMKKNIQGVDQGEFVGLCSLIETRGILKIIKKKDPRMSKVGLVWDEAEVGKALGDGQLMATILEDDSCLGKL